MSDSREGMCVCVCGEGWGGGEGRIFAVVRAAMSLTGNVSW